MMNKFRLVACAAALIASGISPALAQDAEVEERTPQAEQTRQSLDLQGISVAIDVKSPGQIRVGEKANYQVTVTNTAENLTVQQLVLKPVVNDAVKIEKASLQPNQNSGAQSQGDADQPNSVSQQDSISADAMTLTNLAPGESKTIQLTLSSSQEGTAPVCIALQSYRVAPGGEQPTACLQTEFVKPELEIVKTVPEAASICEIIEVEYFVKNTGTGTIDEITIVDPLAEGLMTIEGENEIEHSPEGELEAGEVRKFVARLTAAQAGEFSSRAVVESAGGLRAESAEEPIVVVEPQLLVAISGPTTASASQAVNYNVRVTNQGRATARNAQLGFYYPKTAELVGVGEWQAFSAQQAPSGQSGQPTEAGEDPMSEQVGAESPTPAGGDGENVAMVERAWDIGEIAPGESQEIQISLQPTEGGTVNYRAIAVAACGDDAEARIRTEARFTTKILQLTGLLIAVVDDNDPVATSEQVGYTITLKNQGEAEATNIDVTANLPEQLEYVSAEGVTEAKQNNRQISFGTVKTLPPGEVVQWLVVAKPLADKVNNGDNALMKVQMTSDGLNDAVTSQEPTTLYKRGNRTVRGTPSGANSPTGNSESNEQQDQ